MEGADESTELWRHPNFFLSCKYFITVLSTYIHFFSLRFTIFLTLSHVKQQKQSPSNLNFLLLRSPQASPYWGLFIVLIFRPQSLSTKSTTTELSLEGQIIHDGFTSFLRDQSYKHFVLVIYDSTIVLEICLGDESRVVNYDRGVFIIFGWQVTYGYAVNLIITCLLFSFAIYKAIKTFFKNCSNNFRCWQTVVEKNKLLASDSNLLLQMCSI